MIQFKRGKSSSWRSTSTPLADGQPGYDKDRHKIKIGDGKSSWEKLPDASGLRLDEILDSEQSARDKVNAKKALGLINPVAGLLNMVASALNLDDRPVFTYGTEAPTKDTIGQVYMQYYDAAPETDYVVESGGSGAATGWNFVKWASGKAMCWGTFQYKDVLVSSKLGDSNLYCNGTDMTSQRYPFTFSSVPTETATLRSNTTVSWLACGKSANTAEKSATFKVISPMQAQSASNFYIQLVACGRWK